MTREDIIIIVTIWVTTWLVPTVGVRLWFYLKEKRSTPAPQTPTMEAMQKSLQSLRDAITSYLLSDGVAVFSAIARQKEILNNSNRKAIAVFLSDKMFREILVDTFQDQDSPYIDGIVETFTSLEMPVAYLGELPIYVSPRLQKAPVYVCGEIEWNIPNGR